MPHVTDQLNTALADRYRIERELGQGGMALVYLATDLKHDRKVALKILRPELAAVIGAERFLNEIKVTANLQHPHILPLHDSGRTGGPAGGRADGETGVRPAVPALSAEFLYYVMPYVEGETLRGKIDREKQLNLKEAVEITKQVAAALDYAHRQGVIHRDIKPENVLLHDGQALVADFGIALAVSHAGGSRLTETGLSIGTPHYMSPEQAMGDRELDARSDVYSLGAMLYEMLTGEPPYTGATAQAIVARVITEEPRPLTSQRRTVPTNVATAVHQALSKLPADRFASAADFAAALENPTFVGPAGRRADGPEVRSAVPPFRRSAVLVPSLVALLATALAAWGWFGRRSAPPPVTRERVTLGALGMFPFQLSTQAGIAPDGSSIVWADTVGGIDQLWTKERNQRDATPIPGSTGAVGGVAFSPDGAWILFNDGGHLRKIPRRGGAPITLSDSVGGSWRPAWLDDGTVVFPGPGPTVLFTVPSGGGPSERVLTNTDVNGDGFVRLAPVPGRRAVLIGGVQANFASGNVWLFDLDTRHVQLLVPGASWAEYAGGYLLYGTREGALLAAPVDLDDYALGTAISLDDQIRVTAGVAEATFGRDGTLLYARATGASTPATLAWLDRKGEVQPVDRDFDLSGVPLNGGMRLSPDGGRLALTAIGDNGSVAQDVYVKRLPTGPAARITFEGTSNRRPTWSPDGTRLLFISNRNGGKDAVWTQRADGVGSATLVASGDRAIFEALWSPDGKWLVYRTDDDAGAGRGDIIGVRTDGDTTRVPLVATPAEETGPAISPDSRWLAYAAAETGRKEIYVRPFPNTEDGKWIVSTNGGTEPAWAHSGRELFYRDGAGNMVAVSFRAVGAVFEVLGQQVLFPAQTYWSNDDHRWYDVAPDDQRFIMIDPGFGIGSINLVKVTGLYSELRSR